MERSFEREILPMARMFGLALAPFKVLAEGRLRTDAEEQRRLGSGEKGRTMFQPEWLRNENERKMSAALEKVAKEVGTEHISAVAIAYVLQKAPYVFPVIGGRKVENLMANIDALRITLSDEQIKFLEDTIPFDPGFPNRMIVSHFDISADANPKSFSTGRRIQTSRDGRLVSSSRLSANTASY